jgi:hypothetical protein
VLVAYDRDWFMVTQKPIANSLISLIGFRAVSCPDIMSITLVERQIDLPIVVLP